MAIKVTPLNKKRAIIKNLLIELANNLDNYNVIGYEVKNKVVHTPYDFEGNNKAISAGFVLDITFDVPHEKY